MTFAAKMKQHSRNCPSNNHGKVLVILTSGGWKVVLVVGKNRQQV